MSSVVLIGSQWGDEGKGKITDYLSKKADIIIRYQGGNNAGHTLVVKDIEYKLHLIPSGIIYPKKKCIIGNGVVVDPEILLKEMNYLKNKNISVSNKNLKISNNCHMIMPYHKILDELEENKRGKTKIGTTKKGIGPCYSDKINRIGLRFCDLENKNTFKNLLYKNINDKNEILKKIYNYKKKLDFEKIYNTFINYKKKLNSYLDDTSAILNKYIKRNKNLLFEGAQGTILDIDHGTYPFVTSSNPTAGYASVGSGIGPTKINHVLGVSKAYITRVGEGPFPTELNDKISEYFTIKGNEFGTTTGRKRRCGWFDSVLMNYSININGITHLAITKLDVLDDLDVIKICVAYEINEIKEKIFTTNLEKLKKAKPIYIELPGWKSSTKKILSFNSLPKNAKNYLLTIERLLKTKIAILSFGPKRNQTIELNNIY